MERKLSKENESFLRGSEGSDQATEMATAYETPSSIRPLRPFLTCPVTHVLYESSNQYT